MSASNALFIKSKTLQFELDINFACLKQLLIFLLSSMLSMGCNRKLKKVVLIHLELSDFCMKMGSSFCPDAGTKKCNSELLLAFFTPLQL